MARLSAVTKLNSVNVSRAEMIMNTTSELWGKRTAIIPIDLLDVDYSYQRVRTSHVNEIHDEWDNDQCDYLIVSYRDDKFYIIDGQHRYYAALMRGIENLPCIIRTGLEMEDEARIFVKMNSSRKPLKPYDTYKANIANGNESIPEVKTDMTIKRICDKYNISVGKDNDKCAARKLRSLTTVRRIVSAHGEEGLDWIFGTMKQSNWYDCGEAYMDVILSALKTFYFDNLDDLDKARTKIIKIMSNYSPMDLISYANANYTGYGRYSSLSNTLKDF